MTPQLRKEPIAMLDSVYKYFPAVETIFGRSKAYIRAVDGVSLNIYEGEILGLVGESGSGKTTVARIVAGLLKPDRGRVLYRGFDIYSGKIPKHIRRKIQMIYQDPEVSLDPRYTVKQTIEEALKAAGRSTNETRDLVRSLGLSEDVLEKIPQQLSGGQKQRVAIARALAMRPDLLIADEPTSALDVSTRTQILNILLELNKSFGITIMIITHDLGVAAYMSDRIAVMYLGKIVEVGAAEEIIKEPRHPYTMALISSSPSASRLSKANIKPIGEIASQINIPKGCRFHPRCPFAMEICRKEEPPYFDVGDGHISACWLHRERS
ncbi:MAG: ABC transporter ATP-binding protein [Sulfolobales archaeon]